MLTAGQTQEYARQQKLEELQTLIYGFEGGEEVANLSRLKRYQALLRALLDESEGRTTHANRAVIFSCQVLVPALREFSRTPAELQFMYAEMFHFLIGIIVNETARELSDEEHSSPEVFFGPGKTKNSLCVNEECVV